MILRRNMTDQQAKDIHTMFKSAKSLCKTNRGQEQVIMLLYLRYNLISYLR